MIRLSRPLTLAAVLVLSASGLAACEYVRPPALTIARNSSSEPFFTFSADDLWAEVAKAGGEPVGTTTKPVSVASSDVSQILTGKVRPQILKLILEERKVAVTEQDRTSAQQQLAQQQQQQQQEPAAEEVDFRAGVTALARQLGTDFFQRPGNDIDEYARKYYEQRQQTFALPAQTCLHVVTVDAGDGQAAPTEELIQSVLPKAQELRQRLDTEPFEKVYESTGRSAQGLPGGNFDCQTDDALPTEAVPAIGAVPVGATSQPIKWRAGWVIARVDDRKVARTPTYDEVRTDVQAATRTTFGQQFVTEVLDRANREFVVTIDPRFGRWDAEQGVVAAPEGAASPTIPTTTTTLAPLEPEPTPTPGTTPTGSTPAPAAASTTTATSTTTSVP